MAHQSGTAASTTPSHTATISSQPPNRDQHPASPNSSHRSIPPPPAQPPERRRCQGAAPHWRNDLDSAEHRHIIDGGGTSLVTHNYVDIMSRIYVDSTPVPAGSKWSGEAQRRIDWAPERGRWSALASLGGDSFDEVTLAEGEEQQHGDGDQQRGHH